MNNRDYLKPTHPCFITTVTTDGCLVAAFINFLSTRPSITQYNATIINTEGFDSLSEANKVLAKLGECGAYISERAITF